MPLAGYVNNNFDCDDTNDQVNPNSIWYLDADSDGYGDIDIFFQSCIPPMRNTSEVMVTVMTWTRKFSVRGRGL